MVEPDCECPIRVFRCCFRRCQSGKSQHYASSLPLRYILKVFSPASVIFAGIGVFLIVNILPFHRADSSHVEFLQAAKDVAASKDVLAELFERIGFFFTRLETYTEVTPTSAMAEIITQIMAEVIKIFGIATKELRRGSASQFPNVCSTNLH